MNNHAGIGEDFSFSVLPQFPRVSGSVGVPFFDGFHYVSES